MQENSPYKLILNSKEYELPVQFSQRAQISPKILTALQKDGQYRIQSTVDETVFQPFLKFLTTSEVPEINDSNRPQFVELSHEFDVLKNITNEPSENSNAKPADPVTNEELLQRIAQLEQMYSQKFEEQEKKIQELTDTINNLRTLHRNSAATIQQHTEVIQQIRGTIPK